MDVIARVFVEMTGVGDVHEIPNGLFGNDVHHAGYGVRAVHRRTAATNDLYTVYHRRRHLFQTIDGRHRREDRTVVHQYLGILTLQAVDTQFGLAAVRTGVIDAQSRLKTQHISRTGHSGGLKHTRG